MSKRIFLPQADGSMKVPAKYWGLCAIHKAYAPKGASAYRGPHNTVNGTCADCDTIRPAVVGTLTAHEPRAPFPGIALPANMPHDERERAIADAVYAHNRKENAKILKRVSVPE